MTPLDPTFRPGDRLAAADLTDWQRGPLFDQSRHFRALHQLYGVADGAAVRLAKAGEVWEVFVEPGTAFDAIGRPLRLTELFTMKLLPDLGEFRVVLRGDKPERQPPGVRVPAPPRQARVEQLAAAQELTPWDVPLAGLIVEAGAAPVLDPRGRANAVRGFRRPYLVSGTLPPGATTVPLESKLGWQVWVDTRPAGFLPSSMLGLPPVYLVTLGDQTQGDGVRLLTGSALADVTILADSLGPSVRLSDPRADGFLLTVEYGPPPLNSDPPKATPLAVRWVGVEQRLADPDAEPTRETARTEDVTVRQPTDRRPLPWPTFRDGQRLSPDDLNDARQTARELQWLHNRTLHDWGVAEGFEVAALADRHGVRVERGTAVDSRGRELLLNDRVELALPPQPSTAGPDEVSDWWVTATYRDAQAPRDGDPGCRLEDVPLRRLSQAAVRWRDPRATEPDSALVPGLDVILATVRVVRGVVTDVSAVGRRSAVPPRRPYIAAGRTQESPPWELWPPSPGDVLEPVRGVSILVDTTAGGFVSTPQYLLQLESNPPRPTTQPLGSETALKEFREELTVWQVKRFFVTDPTAANFRVVVLFDTPIIAKQASSLQAVLGAFGLATDPAKQTLRGFLGGAGATAEVESKREAFRAWVSSSLAWRFAWMGIEV